MQGMTTASAQGHEHVFLVSDELEDVAPSSIDEELVQATAEGRLEISLFNGAYAAVHQRASRGRTRDYWLNLAFLDPEPRRMQERTWVFAAGVLTLTALCAWVLEKTVLSGEAAAGMQMLVPVALLAAAGTLAVGLHRYFNSLHFLTRHGRVPVLKLTANSPDRKALGRFVQKMAAAARAAHDRRIVVPTHYLRDEMKEHRRLREGGILDEKHYEAAKTRVLAAHR